MVLLSILEIRLSGSLGSVCYRNAIQDHTLPIMRSPTYTHHHKRTAQGEPHLYYDQALYNAFFLPLKAFKRWNGSLFFKWADDFLIVCV